MTAAESGARALALLAQRAEESPAQPWLFAPDGYDWRWWSWAQAAATVAAVAAGLRAADLPPGSAVYLSPAATPGALLAWLAAAGAGLAPCWEAAETGTFRLECAGGPRPERAGFLLLRRREDGPEERCPLAGGRPAGGSVTRPEAAARHRRESRPVLLRGRGTGEADDRALVLWTLQREAALVLEPNPGTLAATLLWSRPTHLAEPAAVLDRLATVLPQIAGGRDPARRLRRSLRLRTVWWLGAEAPAVETVAFFSRFAAAPRPLDLAAEGGEAEAVAAIRPQVRLEAGR
ncbi:MAG TPA: hypothetical protein PLT41_00050 [Thermoanaerobaculia bacterium]|nr:hypothetical protein [Thermoanaerobaculia bacterium]